MRRLLSPLDVFEARSGGLRASSNYVEHMFDHEGKIKAYFSTNFQCVQLPLVTLVLLYTAARRVPK